MNPTSSSFPIQPLSRFTSSAPAVIKRPVEIACFSYDSDHKLLIDSTESLRYYYTPPLGVSLSEGFSTFENIDDTADEHLDGLIKTLMERERRMGARTTADVIAYRGMLTKMMIVPYTPRYDGFIEENKASKLEAREKDQTSQPSLGKRPNGMMPSHDLMSYWGYKFETLCLLPKTWDETSRDYIENRPKQVVNNYAQYCSIVETSIAGTRLVLGGEIDAVWDAKPSPPSPLLSPSSSTNSPPHPQPPQKINWVELKTTAELRDHPQSHANFTRKLLKFWAQSFLLGVPKIIVGFRTNDIEGRLLRIQEFETTKIPRMVREQMQGSGEGWEMGVCVNFTGLLLDFLRRTIVKGGVWKIRRKAGSPVVEVWQFETSGTGDILPEEFKRWREELAISEGKEA